ncbi:hypothetical protein CPC08DRAFT_160341 [Agrocybe pediades]|nr:hypothetical protein CPC08DRAFT_160341 [Agrocybe pediades]
MNHESSAVAGSWPVALGSLNPSTTSGFWKFMEDTSHKDVLEMDDKRRTELPKAGDPFRFPMPESDGKHWEALLEPTMDATKNQCAAWKEEIQNLLIFAGLFSSVLSAFLVQAYSNLQPDPNDTIIAILADISAQLNNSSTNENTTTFSRSSLAGAAFTPSPTSLRVNSLWFISLILSLTTVLVGIMCLQWLAEYQNYPSSASAETKLALWNMRREGFTQWHVPEILAALPLMLQGALVLFFIGLVDFAWSLNHTVAIPVVIFVAVPLIFIGVTTTLPTLQGFYLALPIPKGARRVPAQCPFKSSQSLLFRRAMTYSYKVFHAGVRLFVGIRYMTVVIPSRILLSLNLSKRPADPEQPVKNLWPHRVNFLEAWSKATWLSFDEHFILLCDAYAANIIARENYIAYSTMGMCRRIGHVYHSVLGIQRAFSWYLKSGDEIRDLLTAYHSIRDVIARVTRMEHSYPEASLLLQRVYFSSQRLNAGPAQSSYLFPYVNVPTTQICEEILLSFLNPRRNSLPHAMQCHLEELHVRLVAFLCQPNEHFDIKKAACVHPLSSWVWGKKKNDISRAFSHFVFFSSKR